MYYLVVFFLLCIGCIISLTSDGKKYEKPMYLLLFICFWFTSGLRYETGVDYAAYNDIYKQAYSIPEAIEVGKVSEIPVELGYGLVGSIFKSLGVEINIMFFFISLVTSLLLFDSLNKYLPEYRFISLLIYFCFVYFTLDMSGVRQAIAVNILFFSFRYIYEKKIFWYLFFVFLASLFHTSAFIGVILYWIFNKRISSLYIVALTILGFLIIAFKIPIIDLIVDGVLSKFMPATAMYKLFVYSTADTAWGLNIKVILNVIILFILVYYRDTLSERFRYFNLILNSLFFYVFLREILWESIDINSRINFYFIFGLVLGLPLIIDLVKIRSNILSVFIVIVLINFYQGNEVFLKRNLHNPYQNYLLYKFLGLESTYEERFLEYKKEQGM